MFAQHNQQPPEPIPGGPPKPEPGFVPTFQDGVKAFSGPVSLPVHPCYCLSEQSAKDLVALFPDLAPTIVHMPPYGPQFFGLFTGLADLGGAPWLLFSDGSYLNAGLLASYWTHGLSQANAIRNARNDIAANQSAYAAGWRP